MDAFMMRQTEASFRKRIHNPMTSDNARVHESGEAMILTGDRRHEKGGIRGLRVTEKVHSPSSKTRNRVKSNLVHCFQDRKSNVMICE
jgi:hypothetical protein